MIALHKVSLSRGPCIQMPDLLKRVINMSLHMIEKPRADYTHLEGQGTRLSPGGEHGAASSGHGSTSSSKAHGWLDAKGLQGKNVR